MPDCDWRPQSAEVAPIKNTCGVDLEKKVPEAEKSVVQVINLDKGLGNGVYACKSDGSFCGVITNDHVVPEGSGPVLIQQGDKDALGQRVAGDPEHDLALLKMSGGNAAPEPAQFGDAPQRRDSVYALCRLQENTIVSTGLAMEPSINMGTEGSSPTPSIGSLQVTFHGCSGTANFNKAGKIVGIVKGGTTQSFDLGLTGSAFGSQAKDLIEGYKP